MNIVVIPHTSSRINIHFAFWKWRQTLRTNMTLRNMWIKRSQRSFNRRTIQEYIIVNCRSATEYISGQCPFSTSIHTDPVRQTKFHWWCESGFRLNASLTNACVSAASWTTSIPRGSSKDENIESGTNFACRVLFALRLHCVPVNVSSLGPMYIILLKSSEHKHCCCSWEDCYVTLGWLHC